MKKFVLYILLLTISLPCFSQLKVRKARKASFGLGVQLGFPVDQFKEVYGGNPFGAGGYFAIPTGDKSPLEFGMAYSWHSMGQVNQDISIRNLAKEGHEILESGNMNVANVSNTYHILARLRPFNTFVQVYFDGLIGFRAYTNKTEMSNISDIESLVQTETNLRDFAWSYGFAGAARFKVAPKLFMEARIENLFGTEATYVDKESIEIVANNILKYDELSSETNLQVYHIGLTFAF